MVTRGPSAQTAGEAGPEPPPGVWVAPSLSRGVLSVHGTDGQEDRGTEGSGTRARREQNARTAVSEKVASSGAASQRRGLRQDPGLRPLAPSEGALVTASLSGAPTVRQAATEVCGCLRAVLEGGEMMASALWGARGGHVTAPGPEGTRQGPQDNTGAHSEPGSGARLRALGSECACAHACAPVALHRTSRTRVSAHTASVHWRRVKRAVLPETDTPLARAPRLSRRVLGARSRPSALVGGCPTLTARGARPSR